MLCAPFYSLYLHYLIPQLKYLASLNLLTVNLQLMEMALAPCLLSYRNIDYWLIQSTVMASYTYNEACLTF